MWYFYRPAAPGCHIDAADLIQTTASARVSTRNTTGKYPEYDQIWADNTLRVVAIFGKFKVGDTTADDAGIAAYNSFIRAVGTALAGPDLVTTPAVVPSDPGVSVPDITWSKPMGRGRDVEVTALLVDEVSSAPESFYARYEQLTPAADLIIYSGHAGLGQNVRALARRGQFVPKKYTVFFMNGCDTFAYVDGSLAQTRAALNPDDPTGTKYMEIVTNAMPAFFASMAGASMALVSGLLQVDHPLTYEQIFANIDPSQVVLVTGEEDNVFTP
jgi:hypothetical protein